MSDLQTFGPVVIGSQVEDAATLTLQTWLPAYLDWVTRQIGQPAGWLPLPRSYNVSNDDNHWGQDQLPAILVVSPGLLERPKQDGQRLYRADWGLSIDIFVSSSDRTNTERLAKYYAAAVRSCLIQKADLGGIAAGVQWRDEKYETHLPDKAQRTLGSARVTFCVDVRSVARALGGPATVPADPTQVPADWPAAQTVTTTFTP